MKKRVWRVVLVMLFLISSAAIAWTVTGGDVSAVLSSDEFDDY